MSTAAYPCKTFASYGIAILWTLFLDRMIIFPDQNFGFIALDAETEKQVFHNWTITDKEVKFPHWYFKDVSTLISSAFVLRWDNWNKNTRAIKKDQASRLWKTPIKLKRKQNIYNFNLFLKWLSLNTVIYLSVSFYSNSCLC